MAVNSKTTLEALMKYAAFVLFLVTTLCQGQGTFTVTFDEPPVVPLGSYRLEREYFESGVWFRTDSPVLYFQLTRHNSTQPGANNGTTHLTHPPGGTVLFSLANSTEFSLVSLDLARATVAEPDPANVTFLGYRSDGSTVSTNYTVSGFVFETFNFGVEFSGLTRMEVPGTYWAIDNVVFSVVPEPSAVALLLLGSGVWLCNRTIRKKVVRERGGSHTNEGRLNGD